MSNVVPIRRPDTDAPEQSLHSLAVDCLKQSENRKDRAKKLLLKKIETDKALRSSLIDDMIETAIQVAVQQAASSVRQATRRAATRPDDTSGLRAVAESTRDEFLNYPIGGKLLGDADKDQLLEWRNDFVKRVNSNQQMADICRFLATKLGPRQIVRNKFSNAEVGETFQRFMREE